LKRDDILARQAALHVRLAQYDSAIALLSKHHFHIWEGGSGVRGTYVDAHVLRGQQSLVAQRYQDALKDYEAANQYPENLEVAGAVGEESPRVDYLLAAAHEALGESRKAVALFERSATAKSAGSAADFYRGLSLRKLGREEEAIRAFDGLIGVANKRISSAGNAAWATTFERRESRRKSLADAHYLVGLGYLGMDKAAEAKSEFTRALDLDICHLGAATQLAAMTPP
jgi:tetratricopeptide (TPR) repeat protein